MRKDTNTMLALLLFSEGCFIFDYVQLGTAAVGLVIAWIITDPCAGSGSTLRAVYELGRPSYGFEVDKGFYKQAKEKMLNFENEVDRLS